jgi:D-glycero-beta-D-manno-heptose-7-phosphate kinase
MADIFKKLEGQQVLIIGDLMTDRYLRGQVTRISPEAPVPVVLHQQTDDRLGGAANVALNIQALGGVPILCSAVGDDAEGQHFMDRLLPAHGISKEGLIVAKARKTTVKTRILGNHQQMLRIDSEDTHDLEPTEIAQLFQTILGILDARPIKAIILQDYNKGILTPRLIEAVIEEARKRNIITAVDPKKSNFLAYRGVSLFKPNLKEIRDSAPFEVKTTLESLQRSSAFIRNALGNTYTMITFSEKGLFLDGGNLGDGQIFPTVPRNIADVSGAGDTVISIASMGLAAGFALSDIALVSNLAGGQVCEYPSVVPVRMDVLRAEFEASFHSKS